MPEAYKLRPYVKATTTTCRINYCRDYYGA